ncbi:hypothetical protein JOD82_002128 [Paenibacillus sp. 1182]|uniref:hypothetical protein n=1 Tax=Paenibacillus sp. 1182 TaxID=2806565 RepID=UPI001AE59BE6|nr:hypothetical protein [Paenibacillus sp. 1182]MBP1309108.1 hypothetical protein [Paenibacillus sp. 1182]
MLKGCIIANIEEKELLESLGVIVGAYNDSTKEFQNCLVSDEAMDKLDDHWGTFWWSLEQIDEVNSEFI